MHTSSVLTLTGATLVTGFVGYALYFDYKRRNDPVFRSQLKKDRKRTHKEIKKQGDKKKKEAGDVIGRTVSELNKPGAIPAGVNEREEVFMQSVQEGEQLLLRGKEYYIVAAAAFFKALKVYPSPLELLKIYQKAVPEEALSYIYEMVAKDSALNIGASGDPFATLAGGDGGERSGSLEEIDDVTPEKSAANPVTLTSEPGSSQDGASQGVDGGESSAPASLQSGIDSGINSPKNGDTSSVEWEKVSRHEEEDKKSALVTSEEAEVKEREGQVTVEQSGLIVDEETAKSAIHAEPSSSSSSEAL